ncbi:uncharacterized protein LY89DRAFT_346155 [Mollisia scopiformis]|uniref:BHLH domain-containing protein n=1 Tax=Mollisia scopiformis TaxID=149040 RepID=A0A132B7X1_MOLSC|nr:uncharacterized protein LY89DRAFT_346155 [Mollisia scopiformis]KUJ07974.1 hypothetical protein LY89DRAFT_346155 [Mollisia scopiformis]
MPRPEQPPTPASSTEIKSKDGSQFTSLQMSFELPPPAVAGMESQPSSASSVKSSSASSYHPTSPRSPAIPASEVVKIRRRSSAAQTPTKDAFALPPPPTRSRKIIQMKPRGQPEEVAETLNDTAKAPVGKSAASTPKKKQPSSTSVAGRKIARKTAHSLIERRRRSKMNEEFGVLKDMIPACTGEMHKLAILQASIDYVRYLEDCVAKLKAENNRSNATPTTEQQFQLPPPASRGSYGNTPRQYQSYDEQEDVEMGGSEQASPTYSTPVAHSNRPSESPAPQDSRNRQDSYSSVSTDQRHYSFSASSTTSPALGPAAYEYARSAASAGSALTSPALLPQRDMDQEATAALLMLNSDRRGTQGSISGRGMSVKDLLTT